MSSCQDDGQSAANSDPSFGVKPGAGGGAGNASPEIVYAVYELSKGKYKYNLQVCDADGGNQTVVVGPLDNTRFWGQPTWSGAGDAVSYIIADADRNVCTLKTTAINVVNGKPVAGTTNTLLTVSRSSDQKAMAGGVWSPTANEIAYSLQDGATIPFASRKSDIYVIPSSGGTPQLIYTTPAARSVYHMSWNADGSKLAVLEWEYLTETPLTYNSYIKIIDRSTGAVEQTVDLTSLGISVPSFIGWSRSGLNQIAVMSNSGSVGVHTIDLDNPGSTTLIQANVNYPAWSGDNSKLLYCGNGLIAETLSNSTTTTLIAKNVTLPQWKW